MIRIICYCFIVRHVRINSLDMLLHFATRQDKSYRIVSCQVEFELIWELLNALSVL